MPNAVTSTGLTTDTQAELVANFTAAMQAAYGTDINLDSNTPDGQSMMSYIQATLDVLDLITSVYNGFDPDLAVGVVLDQRVAYNGIQRQAGTFTITNVTISTSDSLSQDLVGFNDDPVNPYTVADAQGNNWLLIDTASGLPAGDHVLAFQAELPGAVLTTVNTINVPVTVILGVTNINNPTTYTSLGLNEESDAALRIRRQQSVSLGSQGFPAAMKAALENVAGVTSANVYENNSSTTDINGVPGHSMWAVLAGSALAADIANAIYVKRNMGCGMKGAQVFTITQADGSPFVVYWDDVVPQNLFIRMFCVSLDGVNLPNVAAILSTSSGLVVNFAPAVATEVNINGLGTQVQVSDPNTLMLGPGFSALAGGPYSERLTPTAKNYQFAVANSRILILYSLLDTIASSSTLQMYAAGGVPAYTFSIISGAGSIDPTGGLFTPAGAGNTVIQLLDSNGIAAQANITVV